MRHSSFSELMITIDWRSKEKLYQQVERQLKNAILRGYLLPGEHLPSIKGLANNLGVSHVTVEKAYALLVAQGLVTSKPRSGFVVADVERVASPNQDFELVTSAKRAMLTRHVGETGYAHNNIGLVKYDFSYTNLEPGSFPIETWLQIEREMLTKYGDIGMTSYESLSVVNRLQKQAAYLLRKTRDVHCAPEQIIPVAGWPAALRIILALFNSSAHSIAMPEPGLTNSFEIAKSEGYQVLPIATQTADPDLPVQDFICQLNVLKPKLVLWTPSDEFPTGNVMRRGRRKSLVAWAEKIKSYLIEDDSGGLVQYAVSPIPSMQSFDSNGRVIYFTSLSDVLSPSLRIGFLVLPPELLRLYNYKINNPKNVPWNNAVTLATFMERGYFKQQLERINGSREMKRERLISSLHEEMGEKVVIEGDRVRRYLNISVQNGMSHDELVESARRHGVAVYGTRHFWFANPMIGDQIMLGYSSIRLDDIAPGVHVLKEAWFG